MVTESSPRAQKPRLRPPTAQNAAIAEVFERVAELLEAQAANPHRVRAYRLAAETLRALERDASEILAAEGARGLAMLPHLGESLAAAIAEIVATGRFRLLERLEGEVSPEDLFATVPGIGEELAHRIVDRLHVETLEELELASHDGRLDGIPGFGPRRVQQVRDSVAAMLSRSTRRRARLLPAHLPARADEPPVSLLLAIDRLYRERATEGRLRRIAPKRFNPRGRAWLPILHLDREGWSFTALFSNTARAHRLGRTRDWVVVFYERDGHENQCTIVTEHQGPDAGLRVVRGREHDSHEHHVRHPPPPPHFQPPVW